MECFKCGVSDRNALLFDAISNEGIVKVCRKCNVEEKLPLIRKPIEIDSSLKENLAEKPKSVYERMKSLTGYRNGERNLKKEKEIVEEEEKLRVVIEKNYRNKITSEMKFPKELVENFHWKIMRARRARKLTQKELAVQIKEPEEVIRFAERGYISKEDSKLLIKLESALGISLVKDRKILSTETPTKDRENIFKKVLESEEIDFDPVYTKNITIEDLKKLREEKEDFDD